MTLPTLPWVLLHAESPPPLESDGEGASGGRKSSESYPSVGRWCGWADCHLLTLLIMTVLAPPPFGGSGLRV